MLVRTITVAALLVITTAAASAEKYVLLTGVDARLYPGVARSVVPSPGPGVPGSFADGDRLAGTADVGGTVNYVGTGGPPLFDPNAFGSLSFLFRRGSVPLGPSGNLPFMGIEFLGGPRLDLDGDASNGIRSLVPVSGQTPVALSTIESFIDLDVNTGAGTIGLVNLDVTGTNEGGPNVGPAIATILLTMPNTPVTCIDECSPGAAINPAIDTRVGTLTPFTGTSGTLVGVHGIANLGYELWEDTVDANSSTAADLGTFQFLGTFRGWLVERGAGGAFPMLAGQGLGSTLWPRVDSSQTGNVFNTANGLAGGVATIRDTATFAGQPRDNFTVTGNGGLALTDFGGDLGAYLDAVVVPRVPANSPRFVYLEAAGFGINNSNDPVYLDSVSYDAVLIAAADPCAGALRCDLNCDGSVNNFDIDPFVLGLTDPDAYAAAFPNCSLLCGGDTNGDGVVNNFDIDGFVGCLIVAP